MAATGTTLENRTIILFQKNKELAHGALGIEASAAQAPDVLKALLEGDPFPPRQIELGDVSVQAHGGNQVSFDGKNGLVTFSGSASLRSGIGVYQDPTNLLQALGLDDDLSPGMSDLSQMSDSFFVLFRTGYDLLGSAKGSVALGAAGSVTFGLDGKTAGMHAVVRRYLKTPSVPAVTALQGAIDNWRLPCQVSAINDLDPGAWLISEVDGSIAVKIAAQYGYQYNWIRALKTGQLDGEIGLRIQLGIGVALGFEADGKYAVVVGRESLDPQQQKIRLRLFKLSKRGWDFAFNAGASVESKTQGMPQTFDDFLAAVLGVHGARFIKELHAVEKWTDPNNPPPELLANFGVDYAKDAIKTLTGIDPRAAFDQALAKIKGFFNVWDQLDHRAASAVWNWVEKDTALREIEQAAKDVSQLTPETVGDWIGKNLEKLGVPGTPVLQWFESVLSAGVLSAVTDSQAFTDLKKVAGFTAQLLDGGEIEAVLKTFKTYIGTNLKLDWLERQVDQTSFGKLDAWLMSKLGELVGRLPGIFELQKIQRAIHPLLQLKDKFYDKALAALNHNYNASFAYTFQSTTTKTALVDATFDFAAGSSVGPLLQRAVRDGDLNDLLLQQQPGVTLNAGTLTHGIQRHSHLDLTLPYFELQADHLNDAVAKLTAVDSADGRLVVYDLNAHDMIVIQNKRMSSLTVGMHLDVPQNQVRTYSISVGMYSYTWKQAVPHMIRSQLQYQVKPYVQKYWPTAFSFSTGGAASGSFDTWVSDLDKVLDAHQQNATDQFGNSILTLDLSLAPEALSAWLKAPSNPSAFQYMEMSRALQACLKQLIPFYYFADPSHYRDVGAVRGGPFALLVYSCIPPSTTASRDGDKLTLNRNRDVYWDWLDSDLRAAMIGCQSTILNLGAELDRVTARLHATPGLGDLVDFYSKDQLGTILARAESPQLQSLLEAESQIVNGARDAAIAIAKFRSDGSTKPADAIAKLASFGAHLTETFNSRVTGLYGGDLLRPLGTTLFLEAARALDPASAMKLPVAMLGLTVFKSGVKFPPDGFPAESVPQQKDVAIRQSIANVSTGNA